MEDMQSTHLPRNFTLAPIPESLEQHKKKPGHNFTATLYKYSDLNHAERYQKNIAAVKQEV